MAGWLSRRFGKRVPKSSVVEKYSATMGDEWFSVVSGDQPGTICIGIISSAGIAGARVISAAQATVFAGAVMDSVWSDSLDEKSEGVVFDE